MFTVFAGDMYLLLTHNFNSGAASNNDLSTMTISVKVYIDLASKGGLAELLEGHYLLRQINYKVC